MNCCTLEEKTKFSLIWTKYKPLLIVLSVSLLLASIQGHHLMTHFMGYFFVFLSLFKLFDIKGFVAGFSLYDVLAKRWVAYGFAYPFIELLLGLGYLSQFNLKLVNGMTLIIMTMSGAGVLLSVLKGQQLRCACMGTVLNVPLSTVSIVENFGMGAMAAYML